MSNKERFQTLTAALNIRPLNCKPFLIFYIVSCNKQLCSFSSPLLTPQTYEHITVNVQRGRLFL